MEYLLLTFSLLNLVAVIVLAVKVLALLKDKGEREAVETLRLELQNQRQDHQREARENREEMGRNLQTVNQNLHSQISELGRGQLEQIALLTRNNTEVLTELRRTVDVKLSDIQTHNERKLEEMRRTVDEKLSDTLNKRLGESFQLVNDRLEQVHKGLGEMQSLSDNLTDIKKIFTNVKTRGVWGEVQLGHILEEILTPEQYVENAAVGAKSNDRVEYAVCLPGRDAEGGAVYLPIDAKFPSEDYQRLLEAQDAADVTALDLARKSLEQSLKKSAKLIHDKYINPPQTLEYAIMFLPTEGLYAEALQLPSFLTYAQQQQIMVAGPTNLAALLNSVKLGFRTLAIQEKSGEIRKLLGAVKNDLNRFALALDKAQKKIGEADRTLAEASHRTDILAKKLQRVEALPEREADALLAETPAAGEPS